MEGNLAEGLPLGVHPDAEAASIAEAYNIASALSPNPNGIQTEAITRRYIDGYSSVVTVTTAPDGKRYEDGVLVS